MRTIFILNGPNLNLLGTREPGIYGSLTLADIEANCREKAIALGFSTVEFRQSNHEGVLVDWLHERVDEVDGIVVNPASLTPYGRSLAQAVGESGLPVAVVHISSVYKNARPGRTDLFAEVADAVVTGMGARGYCVALEHLALRHKAG